MSRLVGFCCVAIVIGLSVNAHAAENLVLNGSFERSGRGAARLPAGWVIEKGPAKCFRLVSDSQFGRKDWLWADAASLNNLGQLDAFGTGSDTWNREDTGRWLEGFSRKLE